MKIDHFPTDLCPTIKDACAEVRLVDREAGVDFLRNADELLRKIQLQGLAMGFGAGVVFVTGYQLLEAAGAAQMQTDHLIMVMMFSWVAGQLYGMWHYR